MCIYGVALHCRNLRKPYGSVPVRNDNERSVAKAGPRCLFGDHTKKRETRDDQDGRENSANMVDEILILKVDHEVNQLASALALTSELVRVFSLSYDGPFISF